MNKLKKLFSSLFTPNSNPPVGGQTPNSSKGFTLLELLIVIAILATLATIVVLVLNPAETLAKSRDTQRMSDLQTLKAAIALYTTTVSSPTLGSTTDTGTNPRTDFTNTACQSTIGTFTAGEDRIWYSTTSDSNTITDDTLDDTTFSLGFGATQANDAYQTYTDGTGWVPVKLDTVTGGSPISNLPIDPTNTVTTLSTVVLTDLVYRYACFVSGGVQSFELNARLESTEFSTKMTKDGGDNASLFEVGTNLKILGAGATNQF